MNLKEIDIEKPALLFFDMQNGFYHEAGDAKKARANRPDLRAHVALTQVRVVPERVEHTERRTHSRESTAGCALAGLRVMLARLRRLE